MQTRTLEEQFEPDDARRLRLIQSSFQVLRVRGRVSSYYIFEISRAIDSGMLLAAIELATTLLEIWLRDLLVIRKAAQQSATSKHEFNWQIAKIDRELEGITRGLGYRKMVTELERLEVIDAEEKRWLETIYDILRNPLHHGLSGRLLDPKPQNQTILDSPRTKEEMLIASIFSYSPKDRLGAFENYLDTDAIWHLEEVVNFLAAHRIPSDL